MTILSGGRGWSSYLLTGSDAACRKLRASHGVACRSADGPIGRSGYWTRHHIASRWNPLLCSWAFSFLEEFSSSFQGAPGNAQMPPHPHTDWTSGNLGRKRRHLRITGRPESDFTKKEAGMTQIIVSLCCCLFWEFVYFYDISWGVKGAFKIPGLTFENRRFQFAVYLPNNKTHDRLRVNE